MRVSRVIKAAVLAAVVVVIAQSVPDIKRYIELRGM